MKCPICNTEMPLLDDGLYHCSNKHVWRGQKNSLHAVKAKAEKSEKQKQADRYLAIWHSILAGIITIAFFGIIYANLVGNSPLKSEYGRVDEDNISLMDERQPPYDERQK